MTTTEAAAWCRHMRARIVDRVCSAHHQVFVSVRFGLQPNDILTAVQTVADPAPLGVTEEAARDIAFVDCVTKLDREIMKNATAS